MNSDIRVIIVYRTFYYSHPCTELPECFHAPDQEPNYILDRDGPGALYAVLHEINFVGIVIAVNMLTTCNAIFRYLLGIVDKRNKKSGASCERFATLNALRARKSH
jgi:hypothetical protein